MRRRLTNTPATIARSSALPVSFSTMLARVSNSWGVLSGLSDGFNDQTASRRLSMASIARRIKARSLLPLAKA